MHCSDLTERIVLSSQNREPYFAGKDVAEALGYSNSRKALSDHVDQEDKGVTICDTLGGKQEMTVINESGVKHSKKTSVNVFTLVLFRYEMSMVINFVFSSLLRP